MLEQNGILSDIAAAVRERQCVLFLGAGVHARPPIDSSYKYGDSERPLIGTEVSLHLANKSDFARRLREDDPKNLQRVSLDFELRSGRAQLIQEIRSVVQSNKEASPLVRALAQLPFTLIITTNYDTHYEDAARSSAGKSPIVERYHRNEKVKIPTRDYPFRHPPTPEKPWVLKIHGDIVEDAESIVVTDEDYINFVLRMSDKHPYAPLPREALSNLAKWPTLFVGYSLRDYNLRLLFKTLRWELEYGVAPPMYSVDRSPDPLILEVMERRGDVKYIVQDAWRFVPELFHEVTGRDMAP